MTKFVKFRNKKPIRTCQLRFTDYRKFKKHLRDDFHKKCGYCDAADIYLGGITCFHIDHFAPKERFPSKKCDYHNLIYSCSYCNINKGDDWISNKDSISVINGKGFIDPCDDQYDREFYRDNKGNIYARSSVGIYMYNKIKFYLMRHSYIWCMMKLDKLMISLANRMKKDNNKNLVKKFSALFLEYQKYKNSYLEPE